MIPGVYFSIYNALTVASSNVDNKGDWYLTSAGAGTKVDLNGILKNSGNLYYKSNSGDSSYFRLGSNFFQNSGTMRLQFGKQ